MVPGEKSNSGSARAACRSTGDAPSWAEIDAAGALCVLANTRSDDVSLVSLDTFEELARLEVGRAPKHVTVGFVPEAVLEAVATGAGSGALR